MTSDFTVTMAHILSYKGTGWGFEQQDASSLANEGPQYALHINAGEATAMYLATAMYVCVPRKENRKVVSPDPANFARKRCIFALDLRYHF